MTSRAKDVPAQNATETSSPSRTRRRWFQFSLRTLLIFVAVFGLLAAWVSGPVHRANRQRIAVEKLTNLGALVKYDYEDADPANAEPPEPRWLRELLGVDYFANVVGVETNCSKTGSSAPSPSLSCDEFDLFKSFPELTRLSIDGDGATDESLGFLTAFPNLQSLKIDGRFADAGLRRIAQCTQIRELSIGEDVQVSESGFAELQALNELESLDLSRTTVPGEWLKPLARLENLHSLRRSHCPWTDGDMEGVASLVHLVDLDLSNAAITDAGIAKLSSLIHLKHLNLSETPVESDIFGQARLFPELQELHLAWLPVSASGLRALERLTSLHTLDLTGIALGEGEFKAIGHLRRLKSLRLSSARINGEDLTQLARLKDLEYLQLDSTYTTDSGLRSLSGLHRLQRLDLSLTAVSDAGLMELKGLTELKELIASNTAVTDAGVARLKRFLPSANIDRTPQAMGMSGLGVGF